MYTNSSSVLSKTRHDSVREWRQIAITCFAVTRPSNFVVFITVMSGCRHQQSQHYFISLTHITGSLIGIDTIWGWKGMATSAVTHHIPTDYLHTQPLNGTDESHPPQWCVNSAVWQRLNLKTPDAQRSRSLLSKNTDENQGSRTY